MSDCSIEVRSGMEESLLQATTGILIYEGQGHGTMDAFATVHSVALDKQGQPFFLAGRPITRETLLTLSEKLMPDASYDFLPPEILAVGSNWMVWWAEARTRTLFFDTQGDDPIGKCSVKAPLPALVFAVKDDQFFVFALSRNERPIPGSSLFMAPLYNLWTSGKLCQGSARRPDRSGLTAIRQWEDMLFVSAFTHPNQDADKLTCHPKGLTGLWQDIVAGKWKRFPVKLLASANITLADLVVMLKKERCNG